MNLSTRIKVSNVLSYASGTATRTGTSIDMSGWDGALFICKLAAVDNAASGHDFHLASDATSTITDSSDDLAGSAIDIAGTDDDKILVIDCYRPLLRYVTGIMTKDGAHAQGETVICLQYTGRKIPVADMGADELTLLISPAVGTK